MLFTFVYLGARLARRNEPDSTSWWMTGTKEQMYFFVLHRSSVHGQVRLQKMAGDLQDRFVSSPLYSN